MTEDQKVIALLVASGIVEQEKVVEARSIARTFDWNDDGIKSKSENIDSFLQEFIVYLGGFGLSDEQIENLENFLTERLRPQTP